MRTHLLQIAAIAIAGVMFLPTTNTAQPRPPSPQNAKGTVSSKAPSTNNRFALLLLQGGSIGPITSSVIAGGGGTSAAGSFSVTGTIGQAAAGPAMIGSNFSVTSGFWAADSSNTSVAKKRGGQVTSQD